MNGLSFLPRTRIQKVTLLGHLAGAVKFEGNGNRISDSVTDRIHRQKPSRFHFCIEPVMLRALLRELALIA